MSTHWRCSWCWWIKKTVADVALGIFSEVHWLLWLLCIQFISLYVCREGVWNSKFLLCSQPISTNSISERYFLQRSCNDSHQTCLVKLLLWPQWRVPKTKKSHHTGHVESHHVGSGLLNLARPGISPWVMTRDHIRLFLSWEVLILVLEIWRCKVII